MSDAEELIGAIDIGGTKIAVGLVTASGGVVCRRSLATSAFADASAALAAIEEQLKGCLSETSTCLRGIGIGCTGPVNPLAGVVGKVANLPGWEGCRLVEEMASRFKVAAFVENDADAAALAEAAWGCGAGVERFLYITISTGIGAGLLLDGSIYRGVDGSHPEMGHHTIDPAGPLCYCGARGCWESLASGTAIANWFLDRDPDQRFSRGDFSAKRVFELFAEADPVAQLAIDRLSLYIGLGLANLTTILVPDVIAMGGGIMAGAPAFFDKAVTRFRATCGEVPSHSTVVRSAALRHDLDLAGAAAVFLRSWSRLARD
jgi:glucokinase